MGESGRAYPGKDKNATLGIALSGPFQDRSAPLTSLAWSSVYRTGACAWLALSIVGCTEVSEGPVAWTVNAIIGTVLSDGVVDVEVCEADTINCAPTDVEGRATLELPANQEVVLTLIKKDHGLFLLPDFTGDGFSGSATVVMATDRWLSVMAVALGITYPYEGTGVIIVITPLEGATLELVEGTGKAFYHDELLRPTLNLQATTSSGWGGFYDVAPGEVHLEVRGQTAGCEVELGWPGDAKNRVRVPVRAGYHTYAQFVCPSP